MTYLQHYVADRSGSVASLIRRVRVDERTLLNLPGYHGEAFVRVFVEDTTFRRVKRRRFRADQIPSPRLRLRIADCISEIALEFSVDTPGERQNSLFKIDTLLAALDRFRDGLAAEAELRAQRELAPHR